ncbi:MAG TPA: cyclopropane fatty acyl phospholipid synthase [Candidatus Paceibacterota bacterium]|jgi:cyclopropane-fatty-acyl-phospholipid synthase
MRAKEKVRSLLALADIAIDGKRPWDLIVHDERFYNRVLGGGALALGESYVDAWFDVSALDQFVDRALRARLTKKFVSFALVLHRLRARLINLQSASRAFQVGKAHYDVGNDLYRAMLDRRMTYTCGYWKEAKDLTEAQEHKLDLICKKIGLQRGDRVLDIGGGWGSFGVFAAEHYGAKVVAITVSREQQKLGVELAKNYPVEIRFQDYRDVADGPYDHIVSIGMFEHVGYKNYRVYMEKIHALLKDDGCFLLHTIGGNVSVHITNPWIEKYIFPGGMLPSITQMGKSVEKLFVMEDWHNFGADYDKTLMAWFKNFDRAWPQLRTNYSERFYRMWKFYLLGSAGSFRARKNQLWQIVFSKHGVRNGYQSIR